ncbi:Proteasome subunit beta [uncultured archaeon]|nr:Proteasome subunit beta [uncultured archaeon]
MDKNDIAESIRKGTTTVGIVCTDGVVMGADSRATGDTFIASSEAIKVYKIGDSLAMTIAGYVGDAEYLVKFLKVQNEFYKMNEGKPLSPSAASSLLSLLLQENKFAPYIVQLIIGGLNKGIPEVYSLDLGGGVIKESKFYSTGSGSPTALGYLESVYSASFSTQDALKHAAKALSIAMKRDSATGDSIKLVAITKKGVKEYVKEDVDKLLK